MAANSQKKLSERCIRHLVDEMMKNELRRKLVEGFGHDPYVALRGDAEKAINAMSNLELVDLIDEIQSES